MKDKTETNEVSCDFCGEVASDTLFNSGDEINFCESCEDDEVFFVCPHTEKAMLAEEGLMHDGVMYSPEGYNYLFVVCSWSGDKILRSESYTINRGGWNAETIRRDYYDDGIVSNCYNCGTQGHSDNFGWDEYSEESYCENCEPPRGQNFWAGSFKKMPTKDKPKLTEVQNYVGIEFEVEDVHEGLRAEDVPYVAVADGDGSLDDSGMEYKTHIYKGSEVYAIIDDFFDKVIENGYSLDSGRCGLHFHYDLADRKKGYIKNIASAVADFNELVIGGKGFNYFRNMGREYAHPAGQTQRQGLKNYELVSKKMEFAEYYREYRPSVPRYNFVNFNRIARFDNNNLGESQRRIEIRMYYPTAFLDDKFGINIPSWKNRYYALRDDYKNFIKFWDEMLRKGAVKTLKLSDNDGLFNLDKFSRQFSPQIKNWLKSRETANYMPAEDMSPDYNYHPEYRRNTD